MSRVWKEGRVLANLKEKRINMEAAMCWALARHFYECFPLSSQQPESWAVTATER